MQTLNINLNLFTIVSIFPSHYIVKAMIVLPVKYFLITVGLLLPPRLIFVYRPSLIMVTVRGATSTAPEISLPGSVKTSLFSSSTRPSTS